MTPRYDMVTCYVVRPGASGTLGDGEFLQLRRAPGEFLAGAWATVHGKVEPGEKAWAAAIRELREETGLEPREFYQLDTVNIFYLAADDCLWHVPGFCAVVATNVTVTLNEENDADRWISRSAALEGFLWPGERAQVAELCREVLDNGPAKSYLRVDLPPR